jgi:transcriptional regulator with XRE-family HTH domain
MTSLKELLALNMKAQRARLGITQANLAQRVSSSTNYIAMIELARKSPSIEMIERIATALEIAPAELFSVQTVPSVSVKALYKNVLTDMEQAFGHIVASRLKTLEEDANTRNA